MNQTKKPSYRQLATAVKLQSAAAINYRQEIGELRHYREVLLSQRDQLTSYMDVATGHLQRAAVLVAHREGLIKNVAYLEAELKRTYSRLEAEQAKNARLRQYIDVLLTSLGTAQGQPIAA